MEVKEKITAFEQKGGQINSNEQPNSLHNENNTNFAENQENNMDCRIYSLKTFMALDLPKSNIILDPIITERSLAMLYAYRGVGKSFFAMSLALAVATGDKFLRWKRQILKKYYM